jgi:hypothetical protein
MSIVSVAFTGVTTSEGTAVVAKSVGTEWSGRIRSAIFKQTSGSGTQWKFRFYIGDTANPDEFFLDAVTIPTVAGDLDNADGDMASVFLDRESLIGTAIQITKNDYSDGYTSGVAQAGLGLYISAQQLAGSGTDAGTLYLDVGPKAV